MSLEADVTADRRKQGAKCPYCVLIDGRVPDLSENTEPLDPEDREYLATVAEPTSNVGEQRIRRQLQARGYRIGDAALRRHRQRICSGYS